MTQAIHRRATRRPMPPQSQIGAVTGHETPFGELAMASIEEVVEVIAARHPAARSAAARLLGFLGDHDGITWHERWHNAIEESGPNGRSWLEPVVRRKLNSSEAAD